MARFNTLHVGNLIVDKITQRSSGGSQAAPTPYQPNAQVAVCLVGPTITSAKANAASDTLLVIPAGFRVESFGIEVLAQSDAGTTHTIKWGDSGDDDGFDTSVDLKGTTVNTSVLGDGAYAAECAKAGKVFSATAATTITGVHAVNTVSAVSTGSFRAWVKGYMAA